MEEKPQRLQQVTQVSPEDIYEKHFQLWHKKEMSLKEAMINALEEYADIKSANREIRIVDIIKSNLAIYYSEGDRVYDIMQDLVNRGERFILSFENIKRCSAQFLSASIGELYRLNKSSAVENLISYQYGSLGHILPSKIKETIDLVNTQ